MSETATLDVLIQIREEIAGLNKTRQGLQGAKKEAESLGSILKQGLGIGGGMALATGAISALKSTLQSTMGEAVRFAGEIKDASEALNISAASYQVLRLEFQKAGVDAGRLTEIIKSQTLSLAEARDASSAAAWAYKDLGLSVAAIERLPVDERIIAVARAVSLATDKTRAFQAASEILGGRGLPQVLNALQRMGVEGVASLTRLYDAQGQIIGDKAVADIDAAQKTWQGFWNGIVVGSAKALGALSTFGEKATVLLSGENEPIMRLSKAAAFWRVRAADDINNPDARAYDLRMVTELNTQIAQLKRERAAAGVPASAAGGSSTATVAERVAAAKAEADAIENNAKRRIAADEEAAAHERSRVQAMRDAGETIRQSVLTPLEQYTETTVRLNELNKQGAIDATTFGRALKSAYDALQGSVAKNVDDELTGFFGSLDEQSKRMNQTKPFEGWDTTARRVSGAIQDMSLNISDSIVGLQSWGSAWRNLGQIALQMLSEVISKMLVVSAIKGVLGFLGAAIGGPVGGLIGAVAGKVVGGGGGTFMTSGPTNFTVGDNPGGVELVSVLPISGVGQTSINGRAVAMAGGGSAIVGGRGMGGGDTFNFSYAFNGGVTRQEVMAMIPSIVETSKGAVLEAQRRRRGGF